MKARGRLPSNPIAWREAPRDAHAAMKPFPQKAKFIEGLRASNRPTAKDLRTLRALKRTTPAPETPVE